MTFTWAKKLTDKNNRISLAALEFAGILIDAKLSERGEVAEAIVQAMEALYGQYDSSSDQEIDPSLMQEGVAELQFALESYRSQAARALRHQRATKKGAL